MYQRLTAILPAYSHNQCLKELLSQDHPRLEHPTSMYHRLPDYWRVLTLPATATADLFKQEETSGPSCSKHRKLNELVSGQNVNCSSKSNIKFTGIFAEKMWVAFAWHFSAKILAYDTIFNDQSFNDTLTNYIVSFEQLGPGLCF